jgi:hypothetical protein
MSMKENCVEGVLVSYQYHKFDSDDNDMYFFKVEDSESLDKLNKLFRKHWGHTMDFLYRKSFNTYVKVKHQNIEDFFNINFEKGSKFKTNLYIHSCEEENGTVYYPQISLDEQE